MWSKRVRNNHSRMNRKSYLGKGKEEVSISLEETRLKLREIFREYFISQRNKRMHSHNSSSTNPQI